MKRIPLYTTLALALATGIAEANTITETYTFDPLSGYSSESGTSFAEFNPAQGTLNSITLNDTATATFSGGGVSDRNEAEYKISLPGKFLLISADALGNSTATAFLHNLTVTDAGILAAFVGSGNVATSVDVSNAGGTSAAISSTFGTEILTYNFTPTVPVPEPGSLGLLGIGLLGLGLVGFASRRHFAG